MNGNEEFFESESPAEGTQMQGHQFQELTAEDALSYVRQVKSTFENQPQVYNDFLDILKKSHSQSIDMPDCFQQLSNLFRGHPELIVGFNSHLPLGYRIEVHPKEQVCGSENCELESDFQALALETGNALESPVGGTQMQEDQFQKLKAEDVLSYVRQVKSTLENQPQLYMDFLDTLQECHSKIIDMPDCFQQLSNLFRDHPELIVGFNSFLPLGDRIEVHPNEQIQVDFHHD